MSFNFSFRKTLTDGPFIDPSKQNQYQQPIMSQQQQIEPSYYKINTQKSQFNNRMQNEDVDLEKEIKQYNQAQEKLLKEYYKKRHILLNAIKTDNNTLQNQDYQIERTEIQDKNSFKSRLYQDDIQYPFTNSIQLGNDNPNVINIFKKKSNNEQINKQHNLITQDNIPQKINNNQYHIQFQQYQQQPISQTIINKQSDRSHYTNQPYNKQNQQPKKGPYQENNQKQEIYIDNRQFQQNTQTRHKYSKSRNQEQKIHYSPNNSSESEHQQNQFYSAYLKIQEEKLQKQKNSLILINKKIQEFDSRSERNMQVRHNLFPTTKNTNKKNPFKEQQWADAPGQQSKFTTQFCHILYEILSLQNHIEGLKSKLRYKMYQVFKFFKFNDVQLEKKIFVSGLQELLSTKNFHSFQYNQIAQLIYGKKSHVNREQFTRFFINDQIIEQSDTKTISKRRQTTIEILKLFFCDIVQIQYFENKLRSCVYDQKSMLNNLFNQISTSSTFTEQDIFCFLNDKIKIKMNVETIKTYFSKILKRNRKGRFTKDDYYCWLTR